MDTTAALSAAGDWVVSTEALDAPGRWTIGVRVDRADLPVASAGYAWDVGGPATPVVSTAALAPWTDVLTVLVVLALILGPLWWRRRTRSGPESQERGGTPEPEVPSISPGLDCVRLADAQSR